MRIEAQSSVALSYRIVRWTQKKATKERVSSDFVFSLLFNRIFLSTLNYLSRRSLGEGGSTINCSDMKSLTDHRTTSSGRKMKDLVHITVGGDDGLLRA